MVKLTPQQANVLALICKGLAYKDIAIKLNIGYSRVNAIVANLMNKARITGGARAVNLYNWALVNQLVKAPKDSQVEK